VRDHKLLKANGVLAILKFSQPSYQSNGIAGAAGVFIRQVVLIVGGLLSGSAQKEYRHLQNSIQNFPKPADFRVKTLSFHLFHRDTMSTSYRVDEKTKIQEPEKGMRKKSRRVNESRRSTYDGIVEIRRRSRTREGNEEEENQTIRAPEKGIQTKAQMNLRRECGRTAIDDGSSAPVGNDNSNMESAK